MCGITGCIVKNNSPYASEVYAKLIRESDIRGQDGTGITLLRDGEFKTLRWRERAKEIPFYMQLNIGDMIIGQNRYAIFGLDHLNDQPLVSDNFAIVHNGVLYNYEKQFEELGLRRELKVDTELLLRLIEANYFVNGCGMKTLNGFEGDAACLVLTKTPPSLISFMKNKILYSGRDKFGNIYFFSTLYIKNKVPEICDNIKEYKEKEWIQHYL